ncbi:MAG: DUF6493 family protein [Vulcanimicrobiota bacterium]
MKAINNYQALEKLLLEAPPEQTVPALLALTARDEEQRASFQKPVDQLHKALLNGALHQLTREGLTPAHSDRGTSPYYYLNSNITLAVLALGSLAEAKRVRLYGYQNAPAIIKEAYLQVLKQRPLEWTKSWLHEQLNPKGALFVAWELVDPLLAHGVPLDLRSERFLRFFGDRFNPAFPETSLSRRLRERPHLLEVIPALFRAPTSAFSQGVPSGWEELHPHYQIWTEALIELTQDGTLPRRLLLEESLLALAGDFPKGQLSALLKFHQALKPNASELAEFEPLYRALLASPSPQVAAYAVKLFDRAERFDRLTFLQAAHPVLAHPTKGPAMALLKLVRKLSVSDPALEQAGLELARTATSHPHKDVVESAGSWLQERGEVVQVVSAVPVVAAPLDELQLDGIEPRWLELFGFSSDGVPGPLSYQLSEVPFRLTPLEPISTLQQLIDEVAAAVEECRSGEQIERILDGLSRLSGPRTPEFELRTQALKKRLQSAPVTDTVQGLSAGGMGISLALKQLLLSWIEGRDLATLPSPHERPSQLREFLRGRLNELRPRLVRGEPSPLLAAPSHQGGWLLPSIFLERFTALVQKSGEKSLAERPHDVIAALLRLAPHGREYALNRAQQFNGEVARAVRWALGDAEGPQSGDRSSALWLAAGRVREPRADLSAELGFPVPNLELTWSARRGERLRWKGGSQSADTASSSRLGSMVSRFKGIFSRVAPPPSLNPTEAQYECLSQSWLQPDLLGPWATHWRTLHWPQNLDGTWQQAATLMWDRLEQGSALAFPHQLFLEPLFEPDRPWDDLACLVVCLALASNSPDLRMTAVDLMIAGIDDGRAHPTPLKTTLGRAYKGIDLKLNRLCQALQQVAQAGVLHRYTVAQMASRLASFPLPKNGQPLLELLLQTSDWLEPTTRDALAANTSGGKTAKLIERLMALPEPTTDPHIRHLMLACRLERARAWSAAPACARAGATGPVRYRA